MCAASSGSFPVERLLRFLVWAPPSVHPPPIDSVRLDDYLQSHLIDPVLLRKDDFEGFMAERQKGLLELIEQATGKAVYTGEAKEEGEDIAADDDTAEAQLTMASA